MSVIQPAVEIPFSERCRNGSFKGVLRWHQLDTFWAALRNAAGKGWYIYAVGEAVPDSPSSAEDVQRFIDEIDALLRREHDEDYCGIVYADDLQTPALIKIFDPNNLGSSCGSSMNPPKPGWILSLQQPTDLTDTAPLPNNRRRWWNRLFGA
ncbi:hypothetical protein [Acidihalobacter ferrooxydans]|uniref:Uncharacterized protein n=1 Tax=Acidihalobacter ferrooxydans TaxID=1765967 RepID=A0A1P8UKV6_9GAMM|nr:hypothetical protein [Acidihalobacter ferrooxydans]APZ44471.1 hypothetical protein BW247_01325 [Acidihalobacter ferrooxydans]